MLTLADDPLSPAQSATLSGARYTASDDAVGVHVSPGIRTYGTNVFAAFYTPGRRRGESADWCCRS